jgi:1,2-diacylglycerol 3-alpha-glucosyltransferase
MTRVAVLFYRLGPYHLARLRTVGRCLDVTAIEYAKVDTTYGWNVVHGADGFRRVTLFQDDTFENAKVAVVQARIGQALAEARPEVVAIPGWGDRCSLAALHWCVQNRVPTVVMSDSTIWDKKRRWWKESIKRQIVRQFGAGFVAGTPHVSYLEWLGMPPERVSTGFDAVDNSHFGEKAAEAREQRSEVRRKYALPERYFLTVSRFVDSKNLTRLVQAYASYREREKAEMLKGEGGGGKAETLKGESTSPQPSPQSGEGVAPISDLRPLTSDLCSPSSAPWHLVLLGDGPLRSDLCRLISDLSLQDCVLLPGFKQYAELPAYYGLAGAFILPSLPNETWGLVVNEAMASGLPVMVSSACGCAQDLVREGVNGFIFDPFDIEQLAQLMLKLSALTRPSGHPLPSDGRGAGGEGGLGEMGRASSRIISEWGLDRFAEGLSAAVGKATEAGPAHPNAAQRALLQALLWR